MHFVILILSHGFLFFPLLLFLTFGPRGWLATAPFQTLVVGETRVDVVWIKLIVEYQLHLTCVICSFPITNTSWSSWSNPSRRGGTAIAVGWHVFSLVLDPEIPIIPSKRGCITYTSGLVNHDDQLFISLYPPNKYLLKTNISPPKSCLKFLGTQGGIYCTPRFDLDVGRPV